MSGDFIIHSSLRYHSLQFWWIIMNGEWERTWGVVR